MENLIEHVKKAISLGDLHNKILIYPFMIMGYSNMNLQSMELRNKKYKKIYKKYKKKLDNINYQKEEYNEDGKDNIWVCWFQGVDKAPEIVKKCIESIKKYNKDKNIHIIDRKNFKEYVTIPKYILEKWEKGVISNTHFSDILRIILLIEHGGFWLDATTLLTNELPKYISKRNLFMYTFKNIDDISIKANSWFIFSVKDNRLLKVARDLLFEYWKREKRLKEYFLLHFFITMAIDKYPEDWKNVFWITDDIAHTLAYNYYKKYNEEEWNEITKLSFIHKLTYKIDKDKKIEGTFYEHIIKNGE